MKKRRLGRSGLDVSALGLAAGRGEGSGAPVTAYVALLRGVNVGGKRRLPMAEVRTLAAGLGYEDVGTYLQSGNVLFQAGGRPEKVGASLERVLSEHLGSPVDVLLRTRADLEAILAANPYLDQEDDATKLHVTFLGQPAAKGVDVPIPAGESGVLTVRGREVYLHVPDGYGRTKLNNAYLERKLGVVATTRNWRSVRALHDLLPA